MTFLALVCIGARTRERLIGQLARKTEGLRMRDEFIAIASHELRTPLTSMKLHIRLALRALGAEPEDGRRAEDLLPRIDGQTNRIVRLVEDIDRKSTRLNSSHSQISYAVFCLKKKKKKKNKT